MSASISGGFPLRSPTSKKGSSGSSTSSSRRRPSVTSGMSVSSPDVPQLHSMPTRAQSPQTHPPQASEQAQQPSRPHHHHHGLSLHPLTPLNAPTSMSSRSSSSSNGGNERSSSLTGATPGPSASSLSLTSIDSASTTFTTATGVSRASSTRSTSSVQAVPMRKPQRGPAVPRIVTRGMNALSAYGVGMATAGAGTAPPPLSPTWEKGGAKPVGSSPADFPGLVASSSRMLSAEGEGAGPSEGTSSRPNMLQRASWRRRVGSGGSSSAAGTIAAEFRAAGGRPSPVNEDGSAPSSPDARPSTPSGPLAPGEEIPIPGPGSGDQAPLEPWKVLERPGDETGSPVGNRGSRPRRPQPAGSASPASNGPKSPGSPSSWDRPRYERAESSKFDDAIRLRQRNLSNDTTTTNGDRGASLSPVRGMAARGRTRPYGNGHDRDSSVATASTATPTSPIRSRDRESQQAALIGMTPNAMGVVGTRRSTEDFEIGDVLGEGSYSTVTLATTVHPPYRQYALKVLDKEHIKRERKTKYVLIERDTLKALDGHPGIIKLWWTFQDEWSLYYVLEYAENGELLKWIKKYGSFDLRSARYYVAQVLSAVEYMHEKGVIHRDLKPENILLDRNMRVKITDFGTAKQLKQDEIKDGQPAPEMQPGGRPRARSFVGTPEYVSPEILSEGRESSFSSDFWALGCVLYQLLAGHPPFQARTEYLTFQKIINLQYDFPPGFPPHARDLVEKLLVVDPLARLGGNPANGNGIEAIKSHPFFTERLRPSLSSLPESNVQDLPSPLLFTPPPTESDSLTLDSTSDTLSSSFSELKLGSPLPHSRNPSRSHLDDPVDWARIWDVEPPQIETGLCPPVPTMKGQFILLDDGQSSIAPSTTRTGLESLHTESEAISDDVAGSRRSPASTPAVTTGEVDEDEAGVAYADQDDEDDDDLDDLEAVAGSPTSTSGRDLPPASTFGTSKWSDVLLPSETIIMLSPILQRPSSSAAAARTAILGRGQRIKSLNPLNLIASSSLTTASLPNGSPQGQPVPLPGTTPPTSVSMSASSTLTGVTSGPSVGSSGASAGSTSPLPSPPLVPASGYKARTLILTDYPRLICIKETPERISVKSEVFLGATTKTMPRREGVSAFVAVEPSSKDPNIFTVKTTSRNFKYEEPFGHAARWIRELREAHHIALAPTQHRR